VQYYLQLHRSCCLQVAQQHQALWNNTSRSSWASTF
jgi:hypothetical protein